MVGMKQDNSGRFVKVTIIGAGSAVFGLPLLLDLTYHAKLDNIEISLVDVNEENLGLIYQAAKKLCNRTNSNVKISRTTKRIDALPGSDFVLILAEQKRIERWKLDWEILSKFDIKHTLGENRGPGGFSHTLRTVPLVLDICKDVERYSPNALIIVLTNPEDRITYAINKYTKLRCVGYCDGLWDFKDHYLGKFLGIPGEDIYIKAAGINHAVWITEIRNKVTHEDLYPLLVEKAANEKWQPLGYHLYKLYGYWPYENDEHYGEYINYAYEFCGNKGYDFRAYEERARGWKERILKLIDGSYSEEEFLSELGKFTWHIFGDFPPGKIIKGVCLNEAEYLPNINVKNDNNKIPGLPEDMVIEIPAVSTPVGVCAIQFERFPDPVTSFLYREGVIQKLSAEAAVEASYQKALMALTIDPHIGSPQKARLFLEEILKTHREFLPSYW